MSKAISENLQVHISVAFLLKAMAAVALGVGAWYQIQFKFNELERASSDLHEEVVILNSKVAKMEAEHIKELEHHAEELEIENKTLMEKLGMKKKR
jgi:hypothetical protein|tara:strand:+ start:217 stop:504 length:288 start_codon:yes stop_codon:yes gene_type:complete